jgi:peptidoglycan/LPS O-acetylase OafA/YrhL
MLIFRRLSFRICLWLIPLTFLVMGVCRDLSYGLRTVTKMDMSILSIPFPSNLDVFSIGVLVAGLHCRGFLERRFAILGTLGAILFLFMLPIQALAHMKPLEHWEEMILGAFIKLACGLLLLFISNPKSAAVIFLGNPLLRWFGLISYEWYLIHQPLIFWARESFGPAQGSALKYLGVTGGCFLLSLLLGAVIYRIFSLPILRFGRQVGK